MTSRREVLLLALSGIGAAATGFFAGPALLRIGSTDTDTKKLFDTSFADLDGKIRRISDWKDRPLVCNFWATWCAPCREEIPLLIEAREKHAGKRVEILGIAIDSADKVREFSSSMKIPYPILVAGADGLELMRQLGNGSGGLPYTLIVDGRGRVASRKLGAFKGSELEETLSNLPA